MRHLCLLALLISGLSSSAADAKKQPDVDRFELRKHLIEIPERGNIPGYLLLTVSNKYEFIQPPGFLARADKANRQLVLNSRDGRCQISVQWSTNFTDQLPAPLVLHSYVTNLPPVRGLELTGDRHAFTGSGRGHSFEFLKRNGTDRFYTQLILVPMNDFCAVFLIHMMDQDRPKYRYLVGDFLSSFNREKLRFEPSKRSK